MTPLDLFYNLIALTLGAMLTFQILRFTLVFLGLDILEPIRAAWEYIKKFKIEII